MERRNFIGGGFVGLFAATFGRLGFGQTKNINKNKLWDDDEYIKTLIINVLKQHFGYCIDYKKYDRAKLFNNISVLNKYLRDNRTDIINRALEILLNNIIKNIKDYNYNNFGGIIITRQNINGRSFINVDIEVQ